MSIHITKERKFTNFKLLLIFIDQIIIFLLTNIYLHVKYYKPTKIITRHREIRPLSYYIVIVCRCRAQDLDTRRARSVYQQRQSPRPHMQCQVQPWAASLHLLVPQRQGRGRVPCTDTLACYISVSIIYWYRIIVSHYQYYIYLYLIMVSHYKYYIYLYLCIVSSSWITFGILQW